MTASAGLRPAAGSRRGLALRGAVTAVILVLAVAFPYIFPNQLVTEYGVLALIFAAAATSWNFFSGYSGYLSLGHAIFFGTGAYTVAIAARDWNLSGDDIFSVLPLGAVAAAVVAVPLGLVALQVRRHTFVVVTIAFFFIFQLMASNFSFTGGTSGIIAPVLNWTNQRYYDPFYYLALAIAIVALLLSWLIRRSRFGLHLLAIRDDEDRARGLGVRAMRVKLTAFTLSALLTGLLGGLFYYFDGEAFPQSVFDPLFDLSLALMAFFGGLGTIFGPALGALILEPAQQWLTTRFTNGYFSEMLLGAVFLAVIIFLPRGVLPTAGERITAWRARLRDRAAPASGGPPAGDVLGQPAGLLTRPAGEPDEIGTAGRAGVPPTAARPEGGA
ncbi:MAG: branched-chain amino acid ABC transporter permease [Streptosporangiaceae bacterium]